MIVFLSIDKPSKEWIVVPPINKVKFAVYVIMRNLSLLFVYKKYFLINLMIMFCLYLQYPLCISSRLVEFIFMNLSKAKNCR
jgi:hypothetical protein